MVKHETECFLNGVEILLGDIIKGSNTPEMVVLYDEENEQIVVEVTTQPENCLPLKDFLSCWSGLEITGSILRRPKKRL